MRSYTLVLVLLRSQSVEMDDAVGQCERGAQWPLAPCWSTQHPAGLSGSFKHTSTFSIHSQVCASFASYAGRLHDCWVGWARLSCVLVPAFKINLLCKSKLIFRTFSQHPFSSLYSFLTEVAECWLFESFQLLTQNMSQEQHAGRSLSVMLGFMLYIRHIKTK